MLASNALPPGMACTECRRRKTVSTLCVFVAISPPTPSLSQKCDGVKPVCGRCLRLSKDCQYEATERSLRSNVSRSDGTTQEALRDTISSNHALIRQLQSDEGQSVERTASDQPYLPLYTESSTGNTLESFSGTGYITTTILPEGYSIVVPRGIVDDKLQRIASASEVPRDLNQYL